jgi:sugar phosphate isomerase/epimerase
MSAPIAVQLYTVREALGKDFAGVIKKIAGMGYVGVETAGFPGTTPAEARQLFDELGLVVSSAHSRLPVGDQKNEVLETVAALGCKRIICAALPRDSYESIAKLESACDQVNEAAANAAQHGFTLGMHNHWWEFEQVEGRYRYEVMLERLNLDIFFQLDTYWTKVAGFDPVEVIQSMSGRIPLLHIKDGPGVRDQPQVAAGEGVMDIPAIVKAGEGSTEWLIVELDSCATDMLEAVEKSYTYLVGKGLARGNKKL